DNSTGQSLEEESSSPKSLKTSAPRKLSCFRRGLIIILAAAFKGEPLPIGSFVPDFSASPAQVHVFSSG
ncbi:MAG: hypothetical protein F6J98_07995, partial [Moorea sp. SIO4G2]|nr:hypothetical protein [Moorena sp. SIO4G2]